MAFRKRKAAPKPVKRKTAAPKSPANKAKRNRVVLAILVSLATLSVIFFIWARSQGNLSVTENAVGSLIAPLQNALRAATGWVREAISDISDRNQLRRDLDAAEFEIAQLNQRVWELEEDRLENERLRGLLDARDRYAQLDPLYAKVIARNPGVWFDMFSINKGSQDGVTRDMAVINADGLVGHVYEVGLNYAKVRTVIDPLSSVSGIIERTRGDGVLRGQLAPDGSDASLNMYYLSAFSGVKPGDRVLTSGMDGVYPKGIPVGTVQSVGNQAYVVEQIMIVSPLVDFLRIEEVLVLRTMVETDRDGPLPRLPTPTVPAYTPFTPTPSPTPASGATAGPTPDDGIFRYPTPGYGAETPTPTPAVDILIEDQWAEGG